MRRMLALLLAAAALVAACGGATLTSAPQATLEVLGTLPHDRGAFTQGLERSPDDPGTLYEGTGLVGSSQLRELDAATGAVRRAVDLPAGLFGEGITVVGPTIWQLTWRDGVVLEWDRATFTLRRQVPLTGEGWGLCAEPGRLVRSDGTDTLHFHDPVTFAETGSVRTGVSALNELECVDGQVWANVWRTDRLVRLDPATGAVTAEADASGLLPADQRAGTDVLNGIAHLGGDEYLLTGKWWPTIFRVRLTG